MTTSAAAAHAAQCGSAVVPPSRRRRHVVGVVVVARARQRTVEMTKVKKVGMVTTIMACISTYLCMSVFCVNYLELNAVELEPGFQFQAGGADRRNCGRSVELVDVNDLFFKVFLLI